MKIISPDSISGKKVLLRLDIDVAIGKRSDVSGQASDSYVVFEDYRLKAGLPTLKLCLAYASEVIVMGHIGRPASRLGGPKGEDPNFSVAPIYDWLENQEDLRSHLTSGKLKLLENLRFDSGEERADLEYAKELASLGEVFINESFAAYREAASTTVLPTLLPSFAGLRFAEEVEKLKKIRENPKKPLVVIMGGAKVEDKLPVITEMAKIADYVLVGGKIAGELSARGSVFSAGPVTRQPHAFPTSPIDIGAGPPHGAPRLVPPAALPLNVLISNLNEAGTDILQETVEEWMPIIAEAKMIVWNGPLGYVEDPENDKTAEVAALVVESGAETIVGGGDTIALLGRLGLLDKFNFVSTGGGAMLKFLETGTLPTIEVLE